MAQSEPSGLLRALPTASGRLWQSWRRLALPQLLSLADFRSLPDLRIIRLLPTQTRARVRRSV
jgi:hypothetical protein